MGKVKPITPAEIEVDINKLKSSIARCIQSISGYQRAVVTKREEQEELRRLVDNPGEYDVDALKRNVEMCDQHVGQFEQTIEKERANIRQYEQIIGVLENKKCQLEAMLP
ncbi:MAG: hypothetical protein ACXADB_00495 [Candidatus Hermodarchaeia archaeon]|jgi:chromosome segregation ATPase